MVYQTLKDFAGPLATVIAACAAAYFARQQWRTAQEKTLLDLFDRRFSLSDELRQTFIRCRQNHDQNSALAFKEAVLRARFLFGAEVTGFLEQTATELNAELVQWRGARPTTGEGWEAADQKLVARANRLDAFIGEFSNRASAYLKHHQKAS